MVNIGDKFTIREDLETLDWSEDPSIVDEMLDYRGTTVTVKSIADEENEFFKVEENGWTWSLKMMKEETTVTEDEILQLLEG